ncbi:hypothetical protein FisN_8Lh295 [Fistulifera solaris]|uniref:Uncharacterized protein n=1 Tax=Fistulifera solaris TaxID=1519565 RepID=A0A1Z5JN63_FISSO|nr:hypothetical protein FisN_8Lh295 [Fistulifera solaris]|eukprot:GAX15409.1 hypothetical protein FisN_8Lh295 [Fistulifera solaris]
MLSMRFAVVLFLVVLSLNLLCHFWFFQLVDDPKVAHNHTQCQAAFILFGLPKSFPLVWRAYRQNLIDHNPHIQFDVSMHLYSDIKTLTNPKNGEINVEMESVATLLHTIGQGNDVLVQTRQADFDARNLTWLGEKHLMHFGPGWTLNTLKNMFRQGNSMLQSYQHALQSNKEYRVFVFARPDTFLADKVDIHCNIAENELIVPSWQVHDDDENNDRFAVAGPAAARIYVQAKAQGFFHYVKGGQEGDLEKGANFWNSVELWVQWFSSGFSSKKVDVSTQTGKGDWNSEHLLWRWLKENAVQVTKGPRYWAPLLRIRGGGAVNWRDTRTFPGGWLKFRMAVLAHSRLRE